MQPKTAPGLRQELAAYLQRDNIAQAYRKHFGMDWLTAFKELELLGVRVDLSYKERVLESAQAQAEAKKRRRMEKSAALERTLGYRSSTRCKPNSHAINPAKLGLTTCAAKSNPEHAGEASLIAPHIWRKIGNAFCYDIPSLHSMDNMVHYGYTVSISHGEAGGWK